MLQWSVKQDIQIYTLRALLVVNLLLTTCGGEREELPFDLLCERTLKGGKK